MLFNHALNVNGVPCTHHRVKRVELSSDNSMLNIFIDSWPDEQARLDGFPAAGQVFVNGPLPAGARAAVLDTIQASELFSGAIGTVDKTADLESMKQRKWAELKAARCEVEFGGFTWDDRAFDSDPMSQSRIQGAALLATQAVIAGTPFSIDWTLADNTVRTLTRNDMLALGRALGAHVSDAHETGRQLLDAVRAASTVEELEAIVWPA